MKKFLLSLATVLCAGSFAVADEVTVTIAASKFTASADDSNIATYNSDGFTFTLNKANSQTANRLTDTNHLRIYQNAEFTISGDNGQTITAMAMTATGTNYTTLNSVSTGEGAWADLTYNWTGSANSVTVKATGKQARINSITITYVSAGDITVEAPTFSVEEGTYSEAQTVELSAADGCTIYYTTDGATPTDDTADGSTIKYESPITVSETTTIKAIAFDADDNKSLVASATYKIVELLEGATGSGTEADPYNTIAAYNEAIMGSTAEVYVKGIIVSVASIDTGDYGNANYYISADGTETNQFYIYRGYGLGGVKFTAEDDIKAGDEVVVCGKLTTYNEVPQIGSGSKIVELNGEVPGDGHLEGATGNGTEANPYNAAGAYNAALDGSTDNVYVSGTVVSATVSVDYGNANYYISDDGTTTNQFYIFRGLGVNGEAFTAETDLQAGDKVVVYGALTTYNGIPQLAQGSKIISHTSGIGEIEADDNNAPIEYYNLQGVRVANPENGLYIMRQGDKVVKVIK